MTKYLLSKTYEAGLQPVSKPVEEEVRFFEGNNSHRESICTLVVKQFKGVDCQTLKTSLFGTFLSDFI